MSKLTGVIIAFALSYANGHLAYWNSPNNLHHVHGLYVKPSQDGTTGDLYVAASEDNAVNAKWLSDVNFLPSQQVSYTSSVTNLPHDETVIATQKRAVATSPAFKYAFAPPGVTNEAYTLPYGYAVPTQQSATTETTDGCTDKPAPITLSQYSPFQYYYPQMLSSFVNAVNGLKEANGTEDAASPATSQVASVWPPTYAYPYPIQYVVMDPSAWTQTQTAAAPPSPTPVESVAPATDDNQ